MAKVRSTCYFEIPGLGLWTSDDAFGVSLTVDYEGVEIELTIPAATDDFGLVDSPDAGPAFGNQSANLDGHLCQEVKIVRVRVTADAPFVTYDPGASADARSEVVQFLQGLQLKARTFLGELVSLARAEGQFWAGSSADLPSMTWRQEFENRDSGARIPLAISPMAIFMAREIDVALTEPTYHSLAQRVAAGDRAQLPDELIQDAKFLAWIRQPPDLRSAVLMAAIACEAKVKGVLSDIVDPDARELLDIVLKNPRDVTLPVASVFDKTSKAVCGRSLREEDAELHKSVGKLFEARNSIAHGKGDQPGDDEMRDAVQAARRAFIWLESLRETVTGE